MKFVATFLIALLFTCTAISHPSRHVTAHGNVRVVHQLPNQSVRVVARHANHSRVAVVIPFARPTHRGVAVVAYRPHYRAVAYRGLHFHRHHAQCRH